MIELLNPKTFDFEHARAWMAQHWQWGIHLSAIYVILIYLGQQYMRDRQPMKLQKPLIIWNTFLALFSICGTASILPEFLHTLKNDGFETSICHAKNSLTGWTGYWVWLFSLSKALELFDTVFLVLRKRPVIFLHWFHHSSVLIYAFYSYLNAAPNTRWGTAMNYAVHSVMYTYYALRAAHIRLPRQLSMSVTVMQILQMIVGSFVCMSVFYRVVYLNVPSSACEMPVKVSIFQTLLYVVYLYLFLEFFYNAYLKKGGKGSKDS